MISPLLHNSSSLPPKHKPQSLDIFEATYPNKMALETWLVKMKSTLIHKLDSTKITKNNPRFLLNSFKKKHSQVGVLAFKIAGLMSKLFRLWQSLSDKNIVNLQNNSISLQGVRKIVSNDDSFLLGLACAEMVENLRLISQSVSRLGQRCDNSNLRRFDHLFKDFADSGSDPNKWVLSWKEMEAISKKMDKYVSLTSTLHKEMEELKLLQNALKKSLNDVAVCRNKNKPAKVQHKIVDLQQKFVWKKQEVKCLKEKSLWSRSYDAVVSMLVSSIFTVLARIKLVYGLGRHGLPHLYPSHLPRSLSASATVHPTDQNHCVNFVSGPSKPTNPNLEEEGKISMDSKDRFLEANSRLLKPPETTLGAAALALHYANLIIVMEKMIRTPQLVGVDARDDLYSMLPSSVRISLRARLKGVGFTATDPELAGEWKDALGRILGWLSPLAHNMIKWQSERSFEQQSNLVASGNRSTESVLLLQTLVFANKDKTEAAITELLVGLNYIWRFEREMTSKALSDCTR